MATNEISSLRSYKQGKYLIFEFSDGKSVKYDLATGQTYGKSGREVKDICTQLRGYSISSVIDSFEDTNYSSYLKFLNDNYINRSKSHSYYYGRSSSVINRYTNVGTFLSKIKDYNHIEQFFSAGLQNIDKKIIQQYKVTDIPKNLIKICRECNLELTEKVLEDYKLKPDVWTLLFSKETLESLVAITPKYIFNILLNFKKSERIEYSNNYVYASYFDLLTDKTTYNFRPLSLIKYIDKLVAFEALPPNQSTVSDFYDYCYMMRSLSPKFEKYPRYFLTTHCIASRNYTRLTAEFDSDSFEAVMDKSLEYKYGDYVFLYPNSTDEIKDEAVQQNNCVASYIDGVLKKNCHIMFMRNKDNVAKSLVTLELRKNELPYFKVVQARRHYNHDCTPEQIEAIEKFNSHLIKLNKKTNKG